MQPQYRPVAISRLRISLPHNRGGRFLRRLVRPVAARARAPSLSKQT